MPTHTHLYIYIHSFSFTLSQIHSGRVHFGITINTHTFTFLLSSIYFLFQLLFGFPFLLFFFAAAFPVSRHYLPLQIAKRKQRMNDINNQTKRNQQIWKMGNWKKTTTKSLRKHFDSKQVQVFQVDYHREWFCFVDSTCACSLYCRTVWHVFVCTFNKQNDFLVHV